MSISLKFLTAGDNERCISGHMELKNLARLPQATDAEMSFLPVLLGLFRKIGRLWELTSTR